jgi:hypothetical protein
MYALTIAVACSDVFAPVMRTGVAVGAATTGGGVAVAVATGTPVTCVAGGVGVSTITTCVDFGFGLIVGDAVVAGDGLGDVLGLADAFAVGDVFALGVGDGDAEGGSDSADVKVAVASGSGVKLGADVGACAPPVPKNFVSSPPSANPHNTTRIINGMIGMPPRFGGSGSSRRRRG